MNILFLSLSPNIHAEKHNSIYGSLLYELSKSNNIYIVTPLERKFGGKTNINCSDNVSILNVKVGNITKCNIIEKGISTLLIEKQFKSAIKKYFKSVKFDLILYATPPITFCNVIKYIKKRDNAKTYLMLKDIFPQNAVDLKMFKKSSIIYQYFRHKEKELYKISDTIGCMSQKNVEYLLENNSYIDKSKVEVFPNTINPSKNNRKNRKLNNIYRKKYNIPFDSKVFMYGGNLGKPQGIPFIIECLDKVKDIDNAFFVICGTGTEYKKLEQYQKENNIANFLLINGLSRNEYSEFLNIADVGLIFLDYKFTIPNFPSRLLSYLEKGIPVLSCTDKNTDIGDIIENNNFGWKCYSNDSIKFKKLISKISKMNNKDLLDLGNNGFKFLYNKYSSNENVNKILNKFDNKIKHVWIGGVAPANRFDELIKLGDSQCAANNMQLLYIDGIEKNIKDKVFVISSHFIPDYGKNKLVYFKGNKYNNWVEVDFFNFPILKQIFKSINVAYEIKKYIKNNLSCDFIVYIYSMTTPLMYSSKVIDKLRKKYKLNIKIVQVVPDLPEYMNFKKKNFLWTFAKKIDGLVIKSLLKYIDKYILFSKHMATKLQLKKNDFITIEGMVECTKNIYNGEKDKVIMYAGGINKSYGIFDLIDVFGKLKFADYKLYLYGPCSDVLELNNKIKKYDNIKYFGVLPRKEIIELEKRAMILINPRNSFNDFTKYSFPSKTMEYLLSGTPVIMYKLKGIPDEYDKYIYYIDESDREGLKNILKEVCSMNCLDIDKLGKAGRDFVINNKNNIIQCKKIIDWLVGDNNEQI